MTKTAHLRRITVQRDVRRRKYGEKTEFPVIRIEGNWLSDAGFLPNSTAYIYVENGKITIKHQAPEALKTESFTTLKK